DESAELASGDALMWMRETGSVQKIKVAQSHLERKRHRRKYALGELGEDRSFYFRGARGQLNLRAQNLTMFVQMAEGVDDETWSHHLRQGDYSRWFTNAIKDDALAREAAQI